MCRGKSDCFELGTSPASWDKYCPLRPARWLESELDTFIAAVSAFTRGDHSECIRIIESIRSAEMRDWYIEHGQMSGMHRRNLLNKPRPSTVPAESRDPLRSPRQYEQSVFQRDGFRCRYCGIRLVSNRLLNRFIRKLDSPNFRKGPTNLATHGIVHIFNPVADHVVPWVMGGKTDPSNLVSSCGACNYGKSGYSIEEIDIQNPFSRSPIIDEWDGLISVQI